MFWSTKNDNSRAFVGFIRIRRERERIDNYMLCLVTHAAYACYVYNLTCIFYNARYLHLFIPRISHQRKYSFFFKIMHFLPFCINGIKNQLFKNWILIIFNVVCHHTARRTISINNLRKLFLCCYTSTLIMLK